MYNILTYKILHLNIQEEIELDDKRIGLIVGDDKVLVPVDDDGQIVNGIFWFNIFIFRKKYNFN